ncbi:MAG: InlB B-repeat-containing protein, partial [Nitrososphaerota archaeon]|nr:InlB B-repeat-containing protein [Nitrososphaerota archaeon]
MLLTLIPFLSIQPVEADTTILITPLTATEIETTIQNAILHTSLGNIITVTGNKDNEPAAITLNIPTGITVVWKAASKDLSFSIDGGGTFEVADDGEIAVIDQDAITVNTGSVTVSGGTVSTDGDWGRAIVVNTGSVTVSGGLVSTSCTSVFGHECYGIRINGDGAVSITGGLVSVSGAVECWAIFINGNGVIAITGGEVLANGLFDSHALHIGGGLAAYLAGTCQGDFELGFGGAASIIVEVESLAIPYSYSGSNTGLTKKAGTGDLNNVKWDFSGLYPIINFNNWQYTVEWKSPDIEPPDFFKGDSVRLAETGELFDTLNEAITAAKNLHYNTFTLEVIGNVAETNSVIIDSENVVIVGAEGVHTFAFTNPPPAVGFKFSVEGGGSLTLGDGTTDNILTISHTVSVTNGKISVKDGVILLGGLFMSGQTATGSISGGKFLGYIALELERGATISEISGGVFTGEIDAVHLSDTDNKANIMGTKIELISGGNFYQRNATTTLHGHAVFVQNYAEIGTISGGEFDAIRNCALVLIRGGKVGEISGGTFVAHRTGVYDSNPQKDTRNTAIRVDNGWADEAYDHTAFDKTGIGTISGGHIKGTNFGLLILADSAGGHSYVNYITGGTFEGTVAVQVDRSSSIEEITGGTITGSQGLFNVGTIRKISGNVQISGTGSYGIYNYYTTTEIYGQIDEISGNAFITGRDYAIMNSGTITLISGGTFIGDSSAINCAGVNGGKLGTISNGVFWGRTSTTIRLSSELQLEPGLRANMGLGRYQSGNGQIFNTELLVVYPNGYFMSTQTTPVANISGVGFRYLTRDGVTYFINYVLDGGINAVGNPDSYTATTLPCTITDPTRAGYTFHGWMIGNSTGNFGPELNYSLAVGSTGDYTLTATWSANQVAYQVHYYLAGSSIPLATSKTITGQIVDTQVTESAITLLGYTAVPPTTITTTLNATDNNIIFYYTPNPTIQYTVNYYLQNTATSLAPSKTITGQTLETQVTESAITIPGYTAVAPTTITTTLNITDNTITFYYTPNPNNIQYTVYYYLQNTTTSLSPSKTIPNQTIGAQVTESAITIAGYTAVAPTTITTTLNATDNIITFYYTPNVDIRYTVYYYLQNSATSLAPNKIVSGQTMGSTVTESAISITGYTAVAPTTITTTLNATDNIITFYYTQNSGSGSTPTPSPTKSPSPTNSPSPTKSPSPSTSPTPSPSPSPGISISPSPSAPPGGGVDKNDEPVWALVNLIVSVAGVILAIILALYVLLQRNQKQKKQQAQEQIKNNQKQNHTKQNQKTTNDTDDHTEEQKKKKQRRLFWFLLSVILGIVGIVVFLLTEDMSRPMALVDNWTIVNVIIFVVELIAIVLTFKHKDNKDESVAYTVQ